MGVGMSLQRGREIRSIGSKQASWFLTHSSSHFIILLFFSSQAECNQIAPAQFDDSSGRCDEGHLTAGGVKSGGKNREERPGKVQIFTRSSHYLES